MNIEDVYNKYGYIVFGTSKPCEIGEIIPEIFTSHLDPTMEGEPFKHPFQVFAEATLEDWARQSKYPEKSKQVAASHEMIYFYKARTD